MKLVSIAVFAAFFALAACGNSQRVERSLTDVHATLASLPADADAIAVATTFPGTDYFVEDQGDQLIWHFRHQAQDYGRFVAKLSQDGPNATTVSTHFENASDAADAGNLAFLRQIAAKASEASISAALSGRSVDRSSLQQEIQAEVAKNPMAAQTAVIQTVGDEIDRIAQEQKDRAAEDEPIYPKPGVLPRKGGRGGPRDDD